MALITLQEAAAWAEQNKMAPVIAALDTALLAQVESVVLGRISTAVTTTTWTTSADTPALAKTIIAQLYISWLIDRQYSEDEDLNAYAGRLAANAESLLAGIVSGDIEVPGVENTLGTGQPSFYPTDNSSAASPTLDDPSLGGPKFSMGATF
jgi:hypothetical protein